MSARAATAAKAVEAVRAGAPLELPLLLAAAAMVEIHDLPRAAVVAELVVAWLVLAPAVEELLVLLAAAAVVGVSVLGRHLVFFFLSLACVASLAS